MGRKQKTSIQPETEPVEPPGDEKLQFRGFDLPINGVILIAIVCVFTYMGTLRAPFVFDDIHTISQNPYITSIKHIPGFFFLSPEATSKLEHTGWRPLWYTSFVLDYYLGGIDPLLYHITNLAIHFLNAVLVYFIVMFLQKGRAAKPWLAALLAGLFFAVHPVQTESVSYIVGRSASMASLFYLLGFYLYVRYRERQRAYLIALAGLSFCLAALSKEIVVTLPLMVILYDYSMKGRKGRPVKAFAFLIALGAAYTAFRFYIASLSPAPSVPRGFFSHWVTEAYVVPLYILKIMLPLNQNIDPDVREITSAADPRFLVSAVALALVFYGVYRLYRFDRFAGFFGLWFFVALIPETVMPITDYMAEHRVYLPLAGASVLFGYAFERLITSRRAKAGRNIPALAGWSAAIAVIAALALTTVARNHVYASDIALWSDTVAKSPNKSRPVMGLGVAYHRKGDLDAAYSYLKRAIELDPENAYAQGNMGQILKDMGRYKEAVEYYKRSLQILPDDYYFMTGLGVVYFYMGESDKAIKCFKRSIANTPDYATSHLDLGAAYIATKRAREAVEELKVAVQLEPHNSWGFKNLGAAYLALGKFELAKAALSECLRINPGDSGAHFNMAKALEELGDDRGAAEHYRFFLQHADPRDKGTEDAKKFLEGHGRPAAQK